MFAGIVIPTLVLPMMFASTGWLLHVALDADLPAALDYVAVGMLLVPISVSVYATTYLAEQWRARVVGIPLEVNAPLIDEHRTRDRAPFAVPAGRSVVSDARSD